MDILNQVGGLMLGSVPTVILFILLVIAYNLLVQRPLDRILGDRRSRTTGAVEQARSAIAAAEAETAAFEEKLRAAWLEITQAREQKAQQWQKDREGALAEVRNTAQQRVVGAKQEINQSAVTARQQIESATAQLSESILRAVLPKGANISEAHQ